MTNGQLGNAHHAPQPGVTAAGPNIASEKRRDRRLQVILALIALAGALAAPVLGALLQSANKDKEAKQGTISDQQSTIDQLRAENNRLNAEVDNLRQQLKQSPGGATPSPSNVATEFHCAGLAIPDNAYVDLDECLTHEANYNEDDIRLNASIIYPNSNKSTTRSELRQVHDGAASFANCSKGTIQPGGYNFTFEPAAVEGKMLCVKTDKGAWADFKPALDPNESILTADVLYFPK